MAEWQQGDPERRKSTNLPGIWPEVWVSLKEHLEALLAEHDRRISMRFDAMDKALTLSREELGRRLADLNQLRQEVLTDRSTFVTREVYDVHLRESRAATWAAVLALIGLLVTVILRAVKG